LSTPFRPTIAPNPLPDTVVLACHVTQYLTRTDMYLPISVLFIISVILYISPYPQGILILSSLDPLLVMFMFRLVLHNNLNTFGSPASTASHPTAVALTVGKDHSESWSQKQLCILPVALDSRWTPLTAIYAPSKTPSPPRPNTPLPTAMPPSDARQDCQVNSGLLRLKAAAADLVCQREMTNRLVKSLLERLGPPQAENTRFVTQSPFQVSLTTPTPSASLAHSAPSTSIPVECPAPSNPLMWSAPSPALSSSACQEDPFQHFSPPEFDGNHFAGRTFYTFCRSHIHSHPEAFEDDSIPFSSFINDTRTFCFSCALCPFHLFHSRFC